MQIKVAVVFLALAAAGCGYDDPYRESPKPDTHPTRGFGGGGGFGGGSSFCGGGFESDTPKSDAAPPPISGGSMTALSDGTLVIGDADRAVVWLVTGHGEQVRRIALAADDEPGRVIAGPTGSAFVVLRRASQIAKIDVASGVVARIDTCKSPRGVVYRAASDTLFVGCTDGTIAQHVANVRSDLHGTKVADLRDLTDEGHRLIATSFRSAQVFAIDPATGATAALKYEGVPVDGAPHVAWRTVSTPMGTLVAYQTERTSELPLVGQSCGTYGSPTPSLPSLVVPTIGLVGSSSIRPLAMRPRAVLPVDIAANADGDYVIASAGQKEIQLSWGFGGRDAGFGGESHLFLRGQPVSVVARGNEFVVFEREPAGLAFLKKGDSVATEVGLPGFSVESTGHTLFHRATFANIACASCHPEAGDDEHVWNFAEGARRTPTLRGGLRGTAPFHWSGDQQNMSALIQDVMVRRMSGSGQTQERTDALMGWLDAQKAMPAPPTDAASVARGAVVFASAQAQCTVCHSGPQGTNNVTTNVGTDGSFQVPRLIELGCARSGSTMGGWSRRPSASRRRPVAMPTARLRPSLKTKRPIFSSTCAAGNALRPSV